MVILDFYHMFSGYLDVLVKNGLHTCIQQEKKNYQNDELLFLGFEEVLEMQPSVILIRLTV